jgi:hypothetical protein
MGAGDRGGVWVQAGRQTGGRVARSYVEQRSPWRGSISRLWKTWCWKQKLDWTGSRRVSACVSSIVVTSNPNSLTHSLTHSERRRKATKGVVFVAASASRHLAALPVPTVNQQKTQPSTVKKMFQHTKKE